MVRGPHMVRGERAQGGYTLGEDAVGAVPRDNRAEKSRERPEDAEAARVAGRAAAGREV
ncbi:hypothetical protein [Streptomyces sp. NPDC001508]|uniref:hypothetical protein n=1 Tax=Streptomyces sp. NPDC001508 TaxID=3154656 RepID=UPI003333A8B6